MDSILMIIGITLAALVANGGGERLTLRFADKRTMTVYNSKKNLQYKALELSANSVALNDNMGRHLTTITKTGTNRWTIYAAEIPDTQPVLEADKLSNVFKDVFVKVTQLSDKSTYTLTGSYGVNRESCYVDKNLISGKKFRLEQIITINKNIVEVLIKQNYTSKWIISNVVALDYMYRRRR